MPVQVWGISIVEKLLGTSLNWFAYAGIYIAGAVIVGVLAAKIVEYPVLRIRDRLYPSHSIQAVTRGSTNLAVDQHKGEKKRLPI